jgi:hypothetical protein
MTQQPALKPWTFVVGLIVLAAVVGGALAVLRSDPYGERQTVDLPEAIDEALIGYAQTREIKTGLTDVRAMAVADDGLVLVGGQQQVVGFAADGSAPSLKIELTEGPHCLAVGGEQHAFPGRIYVGLKDRVAVFDADGAPVATWERPAENSQFTSIAAGEEDVFVADSVNRVVWRFDTTGKLLGSIGPRDSTGKTRGFVITDQRHFDLAMGADGMLYVVNPRLLRIEAYTLEGDMRSHWGESSTRLEGFCGCCNPTDLAALPDGRFVTAEKGLVRAKLYGATGKLETVVAGPQHFRETPADLAVDAKARVYVLDGRSRTVRLFEPKRSAASDD